MREMGVSMRETAMQTQVLERELMKDLRLEACGRQRCAQAVSVAAAYFEDTLESAPAQVLAAGTTGRGDAAARC